MTKIHSKTHGYSTKQSIRVKNYFNTAVKTFSLYDNVRSIPKITDGLKPSQRKALFGTVARGENAGEIQVERLASMIAACFPGNTLITLADGSQTTILEAKNRFDNGETILLRSYDTKTDGFVEAMCENIFYTKDVAELMILTLGDGSQVSMTPEHRLLTSRGWVMAKDLTCEDNLISE